MPARTTRSDEALRKAVLGAALARATPFSEKLLAEAGNDTAIGSGERARLFPEGVASLIAFYSLEVDRELEERLAALDLSAMSVRKRISTAVLTRVAILKPHKDTARRAAAHLSLPPNLALAARLVCHTVDTMWRATGDLSTDFNFYSKRAILAGVYTATLMRWFSDPDEHATEAFLAARIENVLQFEKLKARMRKQAAKGYDRFAEMLRAVRRRPERNAS